LQERQNKSKLLNKSEHWDGRRSIPLSEQGYHPQINDNRRRTSATGCSRALRWILWKQWN